jgi:CheY-like chemotaxis protein
MSRSHSVQTGRPLVLVAEDVDYLRETTVWALDRHGVNTLPVSSVRQAVEALTLSETIDAAILDIHLLPDHDLDDKGGIEVARLLRASRPTVYIIGYSSHFRHEQLTNSELKVFDETNTKGNWLSEEEFEVLWSEVASKALERQRQRECAEFDRLESMRRLYEAHNPENELLERLREDSMQETVRSLHEDRFAVPEMTAEGPLAPAGFSIRLLSDAIDEWSDVGPTIVWHQKQETLSDTWHNLEVYEHPQIYAAEPALSDAIESLKQNLTFSYETLRDSNFDSQEDDELLAYLGRVLGRW